MRHYLLLLADQALEGVFFSGPGPRQIDQDDGPFPGPGQVPDVGGHRDLVDHPLDQGRPRLAVLQPSAESAECLKFVKGAVVELLCRPEHIHDFLTVWMLFIREVA